ncbi:MAG: AAA family ATPase [bacterium]
MSAAAKAAVLSLAQLLAEQPAAPPPGWIEPGLLPPQGILFVGGEPKVGKSLLVSNLALALAAGQDRAGFHVPAARHVLICQFELPVPQFVSRLAAMRRSLGAAADHNLLVDTRAAGHLLSAPQGLNHFLAAAREAAAEVIVLDPLYSTHDQDGNDTRSMAALCQSLLRLRDASHAALIIIHHVRKSIGRDEIGRAFRGSSALHAVGDSCLLLARPSASLAAVELRFQFRYAPPLVPRLLELEPHSLWFSAAGVAPSGARSRRKVEPEDVTEALVGLGNQARNNQLRQQVMERTDCSQRTAQTGHSRRLPARRHRAGQRPIPLAVVVCARIVDWQSAGLCCAARSPPCHAAFTRCA